MFIFRSYKAKLIAESKKLASITSLKLLLSKALRFVGRYLGKNDFRAFFLIGTGIALVVFPTLYKKTLVTQENQVDISNVPLTITPPAADHGPFKAQKGLLQDAQITGELPVRIIIPELKIDLPIIPSKIVSGTWELSETTASFGLGSAPPNTKGNSVIFAHARPGLFLRLRGVKPGMTVYVLSKENWYTYKVEKVREVLPTQTEVIEATSDRRLTLYTCSGFADSKRLIAVAKPVK